MSKIKLILAAVVPLMLQGCLKDRTTPLPYGFKVVYLDGRDRALIDSNGDFVIYPNITRFVVDGAKIVGVRERPPLNIDVNDPHFTSGFGPFCIRLKRNGSYVRCSDAPSSGGNNRR